MLFIVLKVRDLQRIVLRNFSQSQFLLAVKGVNRPRIVAVIPHEKIALIKRDLGAILVYGVDRFYLHEL